jgi:hypothetical protein
MTKHTPTIQEVLLGFETSFWLKYALTSAMERDVVDAFHDADILHTLLKERLDRVQPPRAFGGASDAH